MDFKNTDKTELNTNNSLDEKIKKLEEEIHLLSSKNRRLEFAVKRLTRDKEITESFLNATIKDLESASLEIKDLKQKELEDKENTIRYQESHLKQISEAMPYSMAFIDLDFKYQLVNNLYYDWFGKSKKDIIGKHVSYIIGKKAFEKLSKPNIVKVFKGSSIKKQILLKDKENNDLFLLANYVPAYDTEKNIIGAYVFAQDITILKQNEKTIERKNEELERYIESNLQLENFAYLASHDLKSPLNNVLNFTKLLNATAADKLDEREKKFLYFINQGTTRMQQFIEDLLAYSLSTNKTLSFTKLNLIELLEEINIDIITTLNQNNTQICFNNIPGFIFADAVLIKQLFLNLIVNANKFISSDRKPKIIISCKEQKEEYLFSVEDNGIGIEKKSQEMIFGLFKRLHLRTEFEGTGIGLSTCRNAVEKHNGKIWVESTEGKGSIFYFTISKQNRTNINSLENG